MASKTVIRPIVETVIIKFFLFLFVFGNKVSISVFQSSCSVIGSFILYVISL